MDLCVVSWREYVAHHFFYLVPLDECLHISYFLCCVLGIHVDFLFFRVDGS